MFQGPELALSSAWKSLPQIGTWLILSPPSGLGSKGNFLVTLFKIVIHPCVPLPTLPIPFRCLIFPQNTYHHLTYLNYLPLFCVLSVSLGRM